MRGVRTVTRPIAWAAALLCAVLLFYLGVLPSFYYSWLAAMDPLPAIVDLGVLVVTTFLIGIVFSRFLLRALPVRADGRRRTLLLVVAGFMTLCTPTILLLMLSGLIEMPVDSSGQQADELRTDQTLVMISWMLGAGIPFVIRHMAPRHFLRKPYVLFLRRFYSFSDRVIVGAVLKAVPADSRVAFLLAPLSTARDWNPHTVGMAGFRLWRPIHSLPIDLHSEDNWQDNARTLIENAGLIVLDGSEGSQAISDESAMIRDGGFAGKTIVLTPQVGSRDGGARDEPGVRGSAVVRYRKSWPRALPGMLLGALGTFIAIFPLALTAAILTQEPGWTAGDPIVWTAAAKIWGVSVGLALFAALFVRPALDRETYLELKSKLRSV